MKEQRGPLCCILVTLERPAQDRTLTENDTDKCRVLEERSSEQLEIIPVRREEVELFDIKNRSVIVFILKYLWD